MSSIDKFIFRSGYSRLKTIEVAVGSIPLGGKNPIRVQTMTNTNTKDVEATVKQSIIAINAGTEYLRITVPSVNDTKYLGEIHDQLRKAGYQVPIVADVHFNPQIAEIAASMVEKVRINPGNYVGSKKFENLEFTEMEYAGELLKIKEKLIPLLEICKKCKTVLRIGVNHGSLSDRIISRYGDTPTGMAESAIEFIRFCQGESFHNIVISMKASNTMIMMQATRLLVEKMMNEKMIYPLHLGVTEAGEGEDGRIKSAAGIGALLLDGIGDTIRVSLTEEPEVEIPVAKKLIEYTNEKKKLEFIHSSSEIPVTPFEFERRKSSGAGIIGNGKVPVVIADFSFIKDVNEKILNETGWECNNQDEKWSFTDQAADFIYIPYITSYVGFPSNKTIITDFKNWSKIIDLSGTIAPLLSANEYLFSGIQIKGLKFLKVCYTDLSKALITKIRNDKQLVVILESESRHGFYGQRGFVFELIKNECKNPVILKNNYTENDIENFQLKSAYDLGIFFLDGLADGIWLTNEGDIKLKKIIDTSFGILQSTRARITKTEFISCPSCGRTNFNLIETSAKIREQTGHLKGLKIGIMGCIVNGLGEMADADYGYVGAGIGKINLYKAKQLIKKNVSEGDAVNELINLIKENGDWVEP